MKATTIARGVVRILLSILLPIPVIVLVAFLTLSGSKDWAEKLIQFVERLEDKPSRCSQPK